jgi:hypothetical protein
MHRVLPNLSIKSPSIGSLPLLIAQSAKTAAVGNVTSVVANHGGKALALGALCYESHSHGKTGRIINLTERIGGAKLHYQTGQKALKEGSIKAKKFYESEKVQTAKKTTIEAAKTTAKVTGLVFTAIAIGFAASRSPLAAICIALL